MYEFWYDYVKPKYDKKAKLCYLDTDSFIVHIKTDGIYKDIEEDVETRFDTSNYELDRPLPKGKNKKIIGSMKDKLGGKIRANSKNLQFLNDDVSEDKKVKGTKTCVIKRKLKFKIIKAVQKQLNWIKK